MSEYVDYESIEYPANLKCIKDAPKRLYYRGVWDLSLFRDCVGVVGSRRMTLYGGRVTFKYVHDLSCFGITIVSGFMYGVDMAAHESCVQNHGRTIAVLPCGIDQAYDGVRDKLLDLIIAEKGLVLSEYPDGFASKIWTFHKRNRIIAGLSAAVLVIEAGLDSGSLITANFAKKFMRPIFAVPGSIFSEYSKGTLQLIRDGAKLTTSASDILEFLNLDVNTDSFLLKDAVSNTVVDLVYLDNTLEHRIYEVLEKNTLSLKELAIRLNETVSDVNSKITLMLMSGLINESENKYFV